MWQKVLIQGIGFVAAALLILSFQCRNSRKLFFLQMCSSMTYVLHFFLLNALSGCANLFCSIARSFVFSQRTKKWAQWKGWLFLLVLANVAATALTWENALSILPFLGTAGMTVVGWKGNGKHIRLANLFVCCPAWLIYDIYSHSIPGALCETFSLCSIAISVMRYGWKALDGDGEEVKKE